MGNNIFSLGYNGGIHYWIRKKRLESTWYSSWTDVYNSHGPYVLACSEWEDVVFNLLSTDYFNKLW